MGNVVVRISKYSKSRFQVWPFKRFTKLGEHGRTTDHILGHFQFVDCSANWNAVFGRSVWRPTEREREREGGSFLTSKCGEKTQKDSSHWDHGTVLEATSPNKIIEKPIRPPKTQIVEIEGPKTPPTKGSKGALPQESTTSPMANRTGP